VNSDALVLENNQNPKPVRRYRVGILLSAFGRAVPKNATVLRRAQAVRARGIPDLDALHIALAESSGCACFITCDDDLLARAKSAGLAVPVMSPTSFLEEHDL
jgi:hypothetical protein